jgi:replicative DNA helicase
MNLIGASDVATEQSVLGAVFLNQFVLDDMVFLEPRDFSSTQHQLIYQTMRYLNDQNQSVDFITVTAEFHKFGRLDDMGGVEYLAKLSDSCPSASSATYYAQIVRSKALRRRGADTADEIRKLSEEEEFESDEEYFQAIESKIADLRPQENGKMKSFAETKKSYFGHLNKKAEFIKTGFQQYDEWAQGLWRGWLFISAGRPSVGKTAMLVQRLYGVAQQNQGSVLLFSQEMDENQIKDRMIASASGVFYSKINKKSLSDNDYAREEMYDKLEDLPIFIEDSAGVTIEKVRATGRAHMRKHGKIAVIAVDYLQIMSIPQKKSETRSQAIGNVTRAAKQLARELNCCFIMLSQMTRESEQKKKPQLSDLKESGSIEQDADVVEFLWHDPSDYEQGGKVVQQFFAKGRDIGMNDFRLLFKGWKQNFTELPQKGSD